jgi:hypothetical protein
LPQLALCVGPQTKRIDLEVIRRGGRR